MFRDCRYHAMAATMAGMLFSVGCRTYFWATHWQTSSFPKAVAKGIVYSLNDILLIALVGTVTLFILAIGKSTLVRLSALILHVGVVLLISALSFGNIEFLKLYEWPVTYPLLYYSDFSEALNYLPAYVVFGFPAALIGLFGAALLFSYALHKLDPLRRGWSRPAAVLGVALAAYYAVAHVYVDRRGVETQFTRSPVVELLSSYATAPYLSLATADASEFVSGDLAGFVRAPVAAVEGPPPKNLILVVMESVASRYVGFLGAPYGVTPNLDALSTNSVTFDSAYSYVPNSILALYSMFTSAQPPVSYRLVEQSNKVGLHAFLKQNGFDTALIYGSDLKYYDVDKWAARQNFDTIKDAKSISCANNPVALGDEPFLTGIEDECTFEELYDWVRIERDKRFFATIWTSETHYPYYAESPADLARSENLPDWVREHKNRYLAALRRTDRLIGRLIGFLHRSGLDQDTALVIVGDHGQAFSQHRNFGHGADIYEESIGIPLLVSFPKTLPAARIRRLAGQIDIAPTIANLLGLSPPDSWEGKNLLAGSSERVFFFSSWKGYKVGFRQGDRKYILDAASGLISIYDLRSDPEEKKDLGPDLPEQQKIAMAIIGQWVKERRADR
ncbi:MAG: sulfatase [Hyphomicrobiales bacterium]|nr:sulfatase [Hyphomicrobiales bacterium]